MATSGARAPPGQEKDTVRIIIADDQKHTRSGLKALLAASLPRAELYEAATGREAERLADEVRPALILMDVRMPDMDGIAATRLIKSRHPEVKVLVLTLHSCCAQDALAAGADAFVSKGDSADRLLGAVNALVAPDDAPPADH